MSELRLRRFFALNRLRSTSLPCPEADDRRVREVTGDVIDVCAAASGSDSL